MAALSLFAGSAILVRPPIIAERKASMSGRDPLDPVTQVHRAAYLSIVGPQAISIAEQSHTPVSLLTLDIYNLRQITDLYNTTVGDSLLKRTAEMVRSEIRETDVVVRYGSQGIMALLPGMRPDQAWRCAHRLQLQIRSLPVTESSHSVFAGCRVAVSSYPIDGSTIQELILSAQKSMADQGKAAPQTETGSSTNVFEFPPRA